MTVCSVGLATKVEPLRRTIGWRTGAEIMKHYTRRSIRHVPIVGLMKVVVKPNNGSCLAVTTVSLEHLSALREPFAAIGLNKETPLIAMNIGIYDIDAAYKIGFGDRCHVGGGAFRGRRTVNPR
jgi:hypothetical protein